MEICASRCWNIPVILLSFLVSIECWTVNNVSIVVFLNMEESCGNITVDNNTGRFNVIDSSNGSNVMDSSNGNIGTDIVRTSVYGLNTSQSYIEEVGFTIVDTCHSRNASIPRIDTVMNSTQNILGVLIVGDSYNDSILHTVSRDPTLKSLPVLTSLKLSKEKQKSTIWIEEAKISNTISVLLGTLHWGYVQVIVQSSVRYENILAGINSVTSEYDFVCALHKEFLDPKASDEVIQNIFGKFNDEKDARGILVLTDSFLTSRVVDIWNRIKVFMDDFYFVATSTSSLSSSFPADGWIFVDEMKDFTESQIPTAGLEVPGLSDLTTSNIWTLSLHLLSRIGPACSYIECYRDDVLSALKQPTCPRIYQILNNTVMTIAKSNVTNFRTCTVLNTNMTSYVPPSFSQPFREDCRHHFTQPSLILNDKADAHIIVVLPIHKLGDTPSGCHPVEINFDSVLLTAVANYSINHLLSSLDFGDNISYGYVVFDSCENPDRLKFQLQHMIISRIVPRANIVGIVGMPYDEEYENVAAYLNEEKLLTISFSASNSELSSFPYFMRMVAPDINEANAIYRIISFLDIFNVGIIYSNKKHGVNVASELVSLMRQDKEIVHFAIEFSDEHIKNEGSLTYIIDHILLPSLNQTRTIIVICTPDHLDAVLGQLRERSVRNLFWIISKTQFSFFPEHYLKHNIDILYSALLIEQSSEAVPEFRTYLNSLSNAQWKEDIFLRLISKLCPGVSINFSCKAFIKSIYNFMHEELFMDSIFTIVHGLQWLLKQNCLHHDFCAVAKARLQDLPDIIWSHHLTGANDKHIMFDSKGNRPANYNILQLTKDKVTLIQKVGWATADDIEINSTLFQKTYSTTGNRTCTNCLSVPNNARDISYSFAEGDVMLYAFLGMYKPDDQDRTKCSDQISEERFQVASSIKWIIDRINQDPLMLPDVKIGFTVVDSCVGDMEEKSFAVLKPSIVIPNAPHILRNNPVIGIVAESKAPLAVAAEKGVRRVNKNVPIIVSSPNEYFNDQKMHPGIFRTTLSVSDTSMFVLDLLPRLGWTYVHIIAEDHDKQLVQSIETDAKKLGICFASKTFIHPDKVKESMEEGIDSMLAIDGATGVIVILREPFLPRLFEVATAKKTSGKLVFIISEEIHHLDQYVAAHRDTALGLLTLKLNFTENKEFSRHFKSLDYVNNRDIPWITEFWESHFQCNLRSTSKYNANCQSNLTLSMDNAQPTFVTKTLNGIYALSSALDTVLKACNGSWQMCMNQSDFYESLHTTMDKIHVKTPGGEEFSFRNRNATVSMSIMNLQLNPGGTLRFLSVGSYSGGKLILDKRKLSMYNHGTRVEMTSQCPGKCITCLSSDFLDLYKSEVARLAAEGPPRINDIGGALGVVTILLVGIGIMFAVMTIYYLYTFASHKVFNICVDAHVCVLTGAILQLGSSFIFLFSPTPVVCAVQQAIPGCVYSVCYAGMLIKLNKTACLRGIVGVNQIRVPRWDFAISYLPVIVTAPVIIYIAWVLEDLPDVEWSATDIQDIYNMEDVTISWSCSFNLAKYLVFMSFFWIIIVTCLFMTINYVIRGSREPEVKQVLWSSIVTSCSSAISTCLVIFIHDDTFRTVEAALLPVNAIAILLINFLPPIITLMKEDYQQLKFREMLMRKKAKSLGDIWRTKQNAAEPKAVRSKTNDPEVGKQKDAVKGAASLWKFNIRKQHTKHIVDKPVKVKPSTPSTSSTSVEMNDVTLITTPA